MSSAKREWLIVIGGKLYEGHGRSYRFYLAADERGAVALWRGSGGSAPAGAEVRAVPRDGSYSVVTKSGDPHRPASGSSPMVSAPFEEANWRCVRLLAEGEDVRVGDDRSRGGERWTFVFQPLGRVFSLYQIFTDVELSKSLEIAVHNIGHAETRFRDRAYAERALIQAEMDGRSALVLAMNMAEAVRDDPGDFLDGALRLLHAQDAQQARHGHGPGFLADARSTAPRKAEPRSPRATRALRIVRDVAETLRDPDVPVNAGDFLQGVSTRLDAAGFLEGRYKCWVRISSHPHRVAAWFAKTRKAAVDEVKREVLARQTEGGVESQNDAKPFEINFAQRHGKVEETRFTD
jgi:hypothetical protein